MLRESSLEKGPWKRSSAWALSAKTAGWSQRGPGGAGMGVIHRMVLCREGGGNACRGPGSPRLPTFAGTTSRSIPASFTSCIMVGESDPQRAQLSNLCESCSSGKMANL